MQFCRRGQLCSPAAAAETDFDKVVSVCESKALRCDEKPSRKASIGRESARNSSVRSYQSSLFLLYAAQETPASRAVTGMVKQYLPSLSSV